MIIDLPTCIIFAIIIARALERRPCVGKAASDINTISCMYPTQSRMPAYIEEFNKAKCMYVPTMSEVNVTIYDLDSRTVVHDIVHDIAGFSPMS